MTKTGKPGPPRTLMEAHEELVRIRPFRNASLQVWLLYYQRSVTVYEQIAQTDPAHQGEAQYWAVREHAHAQQIEARLKGLESA